MTAAMPPTSTDNLEKRTVALPSTLWRDCESFAEEGREKLSEVYRRVMTLGVSAEKARRQGDLVFENKKLINERLKASRDGAVAALQELEVNPNPETIANAIAALKQWLG